LRLESTREVSPFGTLRRCCDDHVAARPDDRIDGSYKSRFVRYVFDDFRGHHEIERLGHAPRQYIGRDETDVWPAFGG
jgi:hypothetical protein